MRFPLQDGYTMEILDIYGVDSNGAEKIIIHDVSSLFSLSP